MHATGFFLNKTVQIGCLLLCRIQFNCIQELFRKKKKIEPNEHKHQKNYFYLPITRLNCSIENNLALQHASITHLHKTIAVNCSASSATNK